MGTTHISITDDFDARHIYRGMVEYSKMRHNSDKIEFFGTKADKEHHRWEEESYKFKNTNADVRLTFYTLPNETTKRELPLHTLEIEVSGEEQAISSTIKNIEMITGIRIRKLIKTLIS